jgi:hypothetical protein
MNYIKNNDLNFGYLKEEEALEAIQNKFSNCLQKVKNKYFVFDYSCDSCYVELKSRRNTHDKYPDTMVGKNKIDFAKKSDRPVYFCFSFTDGLYFWKYNEEDMKTGNVEFRTGGRNDRGKEEYKDYAFIKTNILEKI